MTTEPVLNEETLRDLRVYTQVDDDGESYLYHGVWAVHGDENEVEYPIVENVDNQTVFNSADPAYGEMSNHVLGETFYEFFAGQTARLADEGEHVLGDMYAFAPEELDTAEVNAAKQLLLMLHEGEIPFEVEWAMGRGLELIEEEIDIDEVSDGD